MHRSVAMQGRQETLSRGSTAQVRAVNLRPQPWRWSHPRVFVEHPDEAAGLAIASGLRFGGGSSHPDPTLLTPKERTSMASPTSRSRSLSRRRAT
jgi:hypothetical protein